MLSSARIQKTLKVTQKSETAAQPNDINVNKIHKLPIVNYKLQLENYTHIPLM